MKRLSADDQYLIECDQIRALDLESAVAAFTERLRCGNRPGHRMACHRAGRVVDWDSVPQCENHASQYVYNSPNGYCGYVCEECWSSVCEPNVSRTTIPPITPDNMYLLRELWVRQPWTRPLIAAKLSHSEHRR